METVRAIGVGVGLAGFTAGLLWCNLSGFPLWLISAGLGLTVACFMGCKEGE